MHNFDLALRKPLAGNLQEMILVEIIGVPTGNERPVQFLIFSSSKFKYLRLLCPQLYTGVHIEYRTQRDTKIQKHLPESCRISRGVPKCKRGILSKILSSSLSKNLSQITSPKIASQGKGHCHLG